MVVEVVGGLVSGSLALLADAGHMLTDFAALAMAWLAFRVARRPADARRTYGFDRLSVLAAFVNGLALFAVAAWIVVEAVDRLADPQPVDGGLMLAVAAAGLVVNIVAFWVLVARRPRQPQPPRRAAARRRRPARLGRRHRRRARHPRDRLDADRPDPLGAGRAPHPALGLARWCATAATSCSKARRPSFDAGARSPPTSPPPCPEVIAVRHLHAWSITEARPMVTLEAVVAPGADADAARRRDQGAARRGLGFDHATVETCAEPSRVCT